MSIYSCTDWTNNKPSSSIFSTQRDKKPSCFRKTTHNKDKILIVYRIICKKVQKRQGDVRHNMGYHYQRFLFSPKNKSKFRFDSQFDNERWSPFPINWHLKEAKLKGIGYEESKSSSSATITYLSVVFGAVYHPKRSLAQISLKMKTVSQFPSIVINIGRCWNFFKANYGKPCSSNKREHSTYCKGFKGSVKEYLSIGLHVHRI